MQCLLLEDSENFFLAHDQELFAIELDLGAGVLAEQDAVAGLDIEREHLALIVRLAFADRDNLALLWLLFAESGMMMPPRMLSPSSIRRTRIRSCSGVNDVVAIAYISLVRFLANE